MTINQLLLEVCYKIEQGNYHPKINVKVGDVLSDNEFFQNQLKELKIPLYFDYINSTEKYLYLSNIPTISGTRFLVNLARQLGKHELELDSEIKGIKIS